MTETEWVMCKDPEPMLEFLRGKVTDRKLRLFACACCRRVWHGLTSERGRRAVEVAERFADGLASKDELDLAYAAAKPANPTPLMEVWDMAPVYAAGGEPAVAAARAADLTAARTASIDYPLETCKAIFQEVRAEERKDQTELLRDIICNPFHYVVIDPSWLSWNGGCVSEIAQTIYGQPSFGDLRRLADALDGAGCTDQQILSHCREQRRHVRGCWVIDVLLRKDHA